MPANNTNAYKLWAAGAIAATNVDFHCNWLQTSPAAVRNEPLTQAFTTNVTAGRTTILSNVAIKAGYNAVRVFMPLLDYKIGAEPDNGQVPGKAIVEHDITTIARVGWDDTTVERNIRVEPGQNVRNTDPTVAPRYSILAAQLSNLLQVCSDNGLGMILSGPHFRSTKDDGRLWTDPVLQQNLVDFWAKTALKWKGKPALIAYELINEPSPPGNYASMRSGASSFKGLMERCIAAIRANDTVTPIIVSTPRGGDPSALDFYFGPNGNNTSTANLIVGSQIVYTGHYYSPTAFCYQGIGLGNYHSLGTLYPNIVGITTRFGSDGNVSGVNERDYASDGMTQDFNNVRLFRQYFNLPFFLGEFSSSSAAYYKRVANDAGGGEGMGALRTSTPESTDRAVYNIYYCPNKGLGYIVLRAPIRLIDRTEADPNAAASGFTAKWPINRVKIEIKAYGGANIGPFNNLQVAGTLAGVRRWKNAQNVWCEDNEFLISFPWPNSSPPTSYQAFGAPLFYNTWMDNGQKIEVYQHLVDDQGGLIDPSGVRTVFEYFDQGHGMKKGVDQNNQPVYMPKPQMIASIRILLTDAQVAAQEACRVTHTRDVLRQCATLGLSWAWFSDTDIRDQYLWGDKFWTVDHLESPATGAGGSLRVLLKRATNQSIA